MLPRASRRFSGLRGYFEADWLGNLDSRTESKQRLLNQRLRRIRAGNVGATRGVVNNVPRCCKANLG